MNDKIVATLENGNGLRAEVHHRVEGKSYVCYVYDADGDQVADSTFFGDQTLADAKAWALDQMGDKPCPLCDGHDLRVALWAGDEGEFEALECARCLCAAPREEWNRWPR